MSFRRNLRDLRADRGWSQSETARRAGVNVRVLQSWEAGAREPRIDGLKAVAAAFGVSIDHLVRDRHDPEPVYPPPPPESDTPRRGRPPGKPRPKVVEDAAPKPAAKARKTAKGGQA